MIVTTTYDWNQLLKTADEGPPLVPDGPVDAVVKSAKAGKTKDGAKDKIKAVFEITTGPYAGKLPLYNDFTLSPESPTAVRIFVNQMRALGVPDAFLAALGGAGGLDQLAAAIVGRHCVLEVGHKEWNNVARNEVNSVGAPRPGAVAAPQPLAAPAFAPPQPQAPAQYTPPAQVPHTAPQVTPQVPAPSPTATPAPAPQFPVPDTAAAPPQFPAPPAAPVAPTEPVEPQAPPVQPPF